MDPGRNSTTVWPRNKDSSKGGDTVSRLNINDNDNNYRISSNSHHNNNNNNNVRNGNNILGPKTLNRRNFKNLSLAPDSFPAAQPAMSAKPVTRPSMLPVTANNFSSTSVSKTEVVVGSAALASKFSSLQIGVEFTVDLRMEDLQTVSEIGAGNGGTVSKVVHTPTGTVMAKKAIHIEARSSVRKQIVRELQIMHDCDSPYIVGFYGAFINEGDVVMCMEFMECGSLDGISKLMGPIPENVLGKIAHAVISGLLYLYDVHRIIHRDVKPSNILVNNKGEIKICDFGVSGELINSVADTFVGTSTYMSPERIQGAAYSVKSDVWSLGLTLLELAIGHFPFGQGGTSAAKGPMGILDLLQQIVHEPPPSLPENGEYSRQLRDCIDSCLNKDIELRASPKDLENDPFVHKWTNTAVDTESWAKSIIDRRR